MNLLFGMFICMFVLSHFCLPGSQGIRWSWSWIGSRQLQSLCPASLCRRTSTWDRTFLEEKKILPNVNSLQNKIVHLWIPRSLFYYIAFGPHLLDTSPGWEWGSRTCSVVPENQTSIELFFPFVILLSFLSNLPQCIEVKLNWRSTCADGRHPVPRSKYGQPSVSIPTFANQFPSWITNLHFKVYQLSLQSMSTMCTDPGYLDTPSWNPDCWLGHVSNPRILPGNIKVYSWPAHRRKATIDDWWEVAAHPLSTIQGGPSVPSHRNLCLEMKLILDIINMLALVKECCGVNH